MLAAGSESGLPGTWARADVSPARQPPPLGPCPLPFGPACSWLVVGRTPAQPAHLVGTGEGRRASDPRFVYLDLVPAPPSSRGNLDLLHVQADFNLLPQLRPPQYVRLGGAERAPLRVIVVDWSTWRYLRPVHAFPHWIALLQGALACPLSPEEQVHDHPGEGRGWLLFENGISSLFFAARDSASDSSVDAASADDDGPIPWVRVTWDWDNWSHLHLPHSVWRRYFPAEPPASPPSRHLAGVHVPATRRLILSPRVLAHLHASEPGWSRFWGEASAFLDALYVRSLAALPGVRGLELLGEKHGMPFPLATSQPVPRWVRVCIVAP